MWVAKVVVNYKPGILDPEAKAVQNALSSLGYQDIHQVETGKYFRLTISAKLSRKEAEKVTHRACDKLLSNPVIENYRFDLQEVPE